MTGWKQWLSGEVVEHTAFQTYLQDQVVQSYAGTAARSSALGTAVSEGMVSYLEDANKIQVYDGSAWTDLVAGTATTSGTASYAILSGTAVYSETSGTASYATTAGTADYAITSGTAVYATNAGTAVNISGTVTADQVSGTAVTQGDTGTVTNAMLAGSIENAKLLNSTITLNGTAVALGGSATITGGGTAGGFENPMTTEGDLIVGGSAGIAQRLGIGTAGQYLFSNGTVASWSGLGTATTISGNIGPSQVTAGTFNQGNFTFGSALTVTGLLTAKPAEPSTNSDTAGAVGYVGMPQVALSSGGTTISKAHAGEHIYNTSGGTVTIPANGSVPLEVGTTVVIVNGNNTSTIAITSDTLRQAGTTNTGTRTLAAYGMATLVKVASTTWYISGNGIS